MLNGLHFIFNDSDKKETIDLVNEKVYLTLKYKLETAS